MMMTLANDSACRVRDVFPSYVPLFAHRMMQHVARSVRLGRLITEETQLKEQLKREAAALAAETKAREAVVGSLAKSEAEGVAFREEVEERETRQREARVRGLARRLFLGKAVTVRNVPLASDSVRPFGTMRRSEAPRLVVCCCLAAVLGLDSRVPPNPLCVFAFRLHTRPAAIKIGAAP